MTDHGNTMIPLDEPRYDPELDLAGRALGQDSELLRYDGPRRAARAIAALACQARRELTLLTPDLEPALYDQASFLESVRRLAIERAGRLPVRILVLDVETAVRRSLRLIELARRLTSSIQIAVVPEELAGQCDAFLLVDNDGYCLRRRADPNRSLIDFADSATVRALRRGFDEIWAQSSPPIELLRLSL